MTLYEEVIEILDRDGRVSVVPFKTTEFIMNEFSDDRSEYKETDKLFIGWVMKHWAGKAINNSTLRLSFLKEGKKLIIYKNFDL